MTLMDPCHHILQQCTPPPAHVLLLNIIMTLNFHYLMRSLRRKPTHVLIRLGSTLSL